LTDVQRAQIANVCAQLVLSAGSEIMDVRRAGAHVRYKSDKSPVCEADERAEAVILAGLARHFPDIPVVAEEAYSAHQQAVSADRLFLVDALDGTKDFVGGKDGFTVNIGLIDRGIPVAGAVFAPAMGQLWCAGAHAFYLGVNVGEALPDESLWTPIHTRAARADALTALYSHSHADARSLAFLAQLSIETHLPCSSSLKFCKIAEGHGDIYPRLGQIMEWDTAAGDAILRGAGGIVMDSSGANLTYGHSEAGYHSPGLIALGDPALRAQIAEILEKIE
jgi:3'(2'), 5'-bisphosphate nucleotidase